MTDERIWNLISRQLAGEISQEELSEIAQWVSLHPDNQVVYQAIFEYWRCKDNIPFSDARIVWSLLEQQINHHESLEVTSVGHTKQKHKWWSLKIAAIIIVLLLAGGLFFHYGKQAMYHLAATVKVTPKGTKSRVILPDGSQVWLNAKSKLTYHKDFGEKERQVYLSGEAFFDVEKNLDRPFIIHLDESHIRVVGTSFNVKSYNDDKIIETSVVTGQVMFVREIGGPVKDDSVYYITPNHKLAFFKKSGHVEKIKVDSREDMAWIRGELVFRNATWDEIAKVLERTYNTDIEFENLSLKNCRLTATFHEKTLKEILELIVMTQEFDYEINHRVLIKGKGCSATMN